MTTPKGGRGKKAHYETQQMRVPTPIKDQVNILIAKFRSDILNDPKTDDDLFDFADNSKTSAELETEMENLKTALEVSEKENLNLKTALEETNQQVDNLSSALVNARSEIQNLSTSLEEAKQKPRNLNTSKSQTGFAINSVIGEGDVLKHFNLERRVLRSPREKGETKVNFKSNNKMIFIEYTGQPDGKNTPHLWKITKIEDAPQNLSLAI